VNGHLPESRGQVDGCENGAVGSSDVGDAFRNFLHGVLVCLGFEVQTPEVLHNPESLAVLFWHTEDW